MANTFPEGFELLSGESEKPIVPEKAPISTMPNLLERSIYRTGTRLAEPFGALGSLSQLIPEGARELTGLPFLPERGNIPLTSLLGQLGDVLQAGSQAYEAISGKEVPQIEMPLPTRRGITEKAGEIAEKRYGTREVLKPQNVLERYTDRVAGYIPQALYMGFLGVPTQFLSLATGSLAGQGLEEAGFGPTVQALGELGTGIITSIAQSKIPFNTEAGAKKLQSSAFKDGRDLGMDIAMQDPEVANSFYDTYSNVVRKPEYYSEQTQDIVKDVYSSLKNGISATDGWMTKQRIDKLYKKAGADQPIYQEMRSALDTALKKVGLQNPEFGKQYYIANDVTKGLINYNKAQKTMEKSPNVLSKFSTPAALSLAFYNLSQGDLLGLLKTAGLWTAAKVGGKLARPVADYYKTARALYDSSPTIRNILLDLGQEAITKDKAALGRFADRLSKEVDKETAGQEPISSTPEGFQLLSGEFQ